MRREQARRERAALALVLAGESAACGRSARQSVEYVARGLVTAVVDDHHRQAVRAQRLHGGGDGVLVVVDRDQCAGCEAVLAAAGDIDGTRCSAAHDRAARTVATTSPTVRTLLKSSGLMRMPVMSCTWMARSTASMLSSSRSVNRCASGCDPRWVDLEGVVQHVS